MISVSSDCIGCGVCEMENPEVFKVENGLAIIVTQPENLKGIQDISEQCPVGAISTLL